ERPRAGHVGADLDRREQQPGPQHHRLRALRRRHPGRRRLREPSRHVGRVGLLHRGRRLLRPAERRRDLRRLPVGRVVPRHRRRHRAQRLRRLPLLHRLPRRLARRAAARRRAAAQHRPLHHGRRAGVPDAPAPGARRGRHVDARRVVLLPARPDGGRRWPGGAAARHPGPRPAGHRHRHRRRDHGRLRAHRRHARHHLGADHQGGPADRRRGHHHRVGARALRVQPLRAARGRRGARPRGRPGPARPGQAVRHQRPDPHRLHLPGPGPGARHRRAAAHPHALLHRAHGQGGPPLGGLGDLADRHLLPVHAGPGLRRRCHRRPGGDPGGARRGQLGRAAAGRGAGRADPARHHRRGRVRDDPRGRRRPHDHRVGVVRPRHLRQRDQERRGGVRRAGGQGRPDHRGRHRRRRDRRRHPGQRPEHRLPRRARLRRGGVGQPADHPVLAVLEAVQHHGRAVQHLRRPRDLHPADRVLAGRVGQAGQRDHRPQPVDAAGRGLQLVPAGQPGHRVDPAVVPARLPGHRPEQGRQRPEQGRRDGGPLAHRRRVREGRGAL
ncbi:MAG: Putative symporter YjcG, partial [uncultured Pseudonocardia sp.]